MKKLLIMVAGLATATISFAQKSAVEDAAIYLRNGEMADAKKAIDAAAVHEDTKNFPKMWYYRAVVYDTLLRNKEYASLIGPDAVEQFVIATKQCLVTSPGKGTFNDYCNVAIIQSSFDAYNEAIGYMQKKEYDKAIKFLQYVLDAIPFDKEGQLKKNNLSDKQIYLAIADVAYKGKNVPVAKSSLQKLMDMDYNDHLIYAFMGNLYLEEGDTTKAIEFIDKGRKRFPTEKDLISMELNIYLTQGKSDVLVNKINEALNVDAENYTLYYIRGNIYDRFADDARRGSRAAADTATKITKKAKVEKVPANKAKLDAAAKKYKSLSDSLDKQMLAYIASADADYRKVVEINPEYFDGHYALGVMINNYKNTEIVEKINNIQASTQEDYDKKLAPLKKEQVAILNQALVHFNDALRVAENMSASDENKKAERKELMRMALESIKQVYANLGDEQKFMETKKRKEELDRE